MLVGPSQISGIRAQREFQEKVRVHGVPWTIVDSEGHVSKAHCTVVILAHSSVILMKGSSLSYQ